MPSLLRVVQALADVARLAIATPTTAPAAVATASQATANQAPRDRAAAKGAAASLLRVTVRLNPGQLQVLWPWQLHGVAGVRVVRLQALDRHEAHRAAVPACNPTGCAMQRCLRRSRPMHPRLLRVRLWLARTRLRQGRCACTPHVDAHLPVPVMFVRGACTPIGVPLSEQA